MTPVANSAEMEAAWLDLAGEEKAASILALAPDGVSDIAEVGCGAGSVLGVLDRRGFADRYWACEPAKSLFDLIPRTEISRLVSAEPATFDQAFDGRAFDLVILSHVLEHLLSPAVLLHDALLRSEYVVFEVPIENNVLGRVRAATKAAAGTPRLSNAAGHVQFFSRHSARLLASHAGGRVLATRAYFPVAPYRAQADTRWRKAVAATAHVGAVARRYHEHYALLVTRAEEGARHAHYLAPV